MIFEKIVDEAEIRGKRAGEVLHWEITLNGKLLIRGNGAMCDYTPNGEDGLEKAPWRAYSNYIRKVIVCEGVTEIGSNAFFECRELESVQLPKSMKKISYSAFRGCRKLEEVVTARPVRFDHIYEPVTEEENPLPVIKMGLHAFSETPFAVKKWGDLYIRGGIVVDYFGTAEEVCVPQDVLKIGIMAFCGCRIKQVELPEGLLEIESFAFAQTQLERVALPRGLRVMQYGAFSDIENKLELSYSEMTELEAEDTVFLDTCIRREGKKRIPCLYRLELKAESGIRGFKRIVIKRENEAIGIGEFNAGESLWRRIERGAHIICLTSDPVEKTLSDVIVFEWNREKNCPVRWSVKAFDESGRCPERICVKAVRGWDMTKEEFMEWFQADHVKQLKEKGLIRNEPDFGKEEWYWISGGLDGSASAEELVNQWLKMHEGYQVKLVEESK